jgi:hypothetical protein
LQKLSALFALMVGVDLGLLVNGNGAVISVVVEIGLS